MVEQPQGDVQPTRGNHTLCKASPHSPERSPRPPGLCKPDLDFLPAAAGRGAAAAGRFRTGTGGMIHRALGSLSHSDSSGAPSLARLTD